MISIHLARKPLAPDLTVAQNALIYGTGGLSIDATRITLSGISPSVARRKSKLPIHYTDEGRWKDRRSPEQYHLDRPGEQLGRWPANLILEHLQGCQCTGTRKIKGGSDPRRKDGTAHGHTSEGWGTGLKTRACDHAGFSDEEGLETVASWQCEPGCPVAQMDEQSGLSKPSPKAVRPKGDCKGARWDPSTADAIGTWPEDFGGGASRFFFIVQA